ncbi:Subunit of a complex with Ctf18p [Aspergillus fumigatus]|nr:Subunit of a complex with Ctf18p [Aspergillus fumigatus]KAH1314057.1 Subunit of a complex with Ctf18p [Aspergillus fumigatus]KAH1347835.1 Subunit of a complex with Ctf18p [Aspergillus fumigatus]KAH1375449.1 Subunit of a complex with Ctf18p [Aspergillus fumigatus]KAH1536386.1 Subunit of a complex with Ctf18p [Aspergillus fumigatus]
MTSSPPLIPPSFDPAIQLHSEEQNPLSETFSDDLEALNLLRLENIRNKVVIQHRAWNLSDVFRSDEDVRPDTPTRARKALHESNEIPEINSGFYLPSSPPVTKMPFISSPVAFPSRAASPNEAQKRKNDEQSQLMEPKRQKIMGGFLDEEDEDEDELAAFQDAQMKSQFELEEQLIEQELVDPPQIVSGPIHTDPSTTSASDSIAPTYDVPRRTTQLVKIKTCSGKTHTVTQRTYKPRVSYERLVASRSTTGLGRAQKSYYGINIHQILDEVARETEQAKASTKALDRTIQHSVEAPLEGQRNKKMAAAMWTEKYRARKFTELIGDERIHRSVLRWLKGWEPIVFPNLAKSRIKKPGNNNDDGERLHRKVLLLCGPPGLGKTTLAHVCAKQAGYEVLEINASDDRSKDVVKGRIRDALGTENVKGVNVEVGDRKVRKAGRPVCVVVDEVDGVVSGSGSGGEGGFMKALIDLVLLDQKNMARSADQNAKNGKKRNTFRFLRPLILVCNDVYHPSLRPLRTSSVAEIIHVRQAPFENVVSRLKSILALEGIPSDNDGVRRLCEASWGLARKKSGGLKSSGTAEGDIRSVLVAAEWVAHKLRNENLSSLRLTRSWLEQRVLSGAAEASFFKGLNRGGVRDIVDRVFLEGGGFPDAPMNAESFHDPFASPSGNVPLGVADLRKRHAINKLREMVDASGDHDRCVSECFATYPLQSYQDDTFLSKPNAAYDWLHFHDTISSKVFASQEWELTPYLSQTVIAFHHLFSSVGGKRISKNFDDDEEDEHPFSGPRADFAAFEAQKQSRAILTGFQSSLSAPLLRLFRSMDCLATELIPNLIRMLSPDVRPVVVRGSGEQKSVASVRKDSERALVQAAVRVMTGLGVVFEKVRIESEGGGHGGWAYRMEPPLDSLVTFHKTKGTSADSGGTAPVRYAVRQVLDQEYRKETMRKQSEVLSSSKPGQTWNDKSGKNDDQSAKKNAIRNAPGIKRDFFGRILKDPEPLLQRSDDSPVQNEASKAGRKVWVTYHDGFSNAVRKPISMNELMAGL